MSKKKKVSADMKLMAVKEYLAGSGFLTTVGKKYGVTESSFRKWVAKYRAFGDSAFIQTTRCNHYTFEFKMKVVSEYLDCCICQLKFRSLGVRTKSWTKFRLGGATCSHTKNE